MKRKPIFSMEQRRAIRSMVKREVNKQLRELDGSPNAIGFANSDHIPEEQPDEYDG